MEENSITIDLTSKDLYEFNMYHSYTHSQGIASVIFGIAAIVLAFAEMSQLSTARFAVQILLGIAILCYIPCTLFLRAKTAVKTGGAFDKSIGVRFDESGVNIRVGEDENVIAWKDIYRLKNRKNQFLIYTGRITALIVPKRCISDELIGKVEEYYKQNADE